jgi:protein phosphatase
MVNDPAKLYCPNEDCQAANPLTCKFCEQCGTSLPKRYLWAVGNDLSLGSPGEILADRYLVISSSILLDTRPGLLPQTPELDDLQAIKAYLKLIPYRLHIPQVYGVLPLNDGQTHREILLLEKPPLLTDATVSHIQICSQLTAAWRDTSSIRQINWLWQIAHLWQPLASEGVASSLIDPYLLRVEGSLVRLLELRVDAPTAPDLTQLGEFWQQLIAAAKPAIAEFLQRICQALIQKEINSCEQLITVLDRGLAQLRNSQKTAIKIFTKTDTGPSRQRNEDACYPPAETLVSKPPQQIALAIVCDGIGGHEGGNVASNLAIDTIQQQVKELTSVPYDHIDPQLLLNDLESAVAVVNDKISQRNDNENRQGRKRMGTTLVMALPMAHEMYITHVGDSRAYWITRHGCYQVTLDDDVASREVRLGYAVYREAVQQGGAGSLVQALGMSKSTSLHPTAQRFIIDEDAIFLLASDGLTDYDRIEEHWETEILPIISEGWDVVTVTNKLVEIANTKNGHDNVTIALLYEQVQYSEPESTIQADITSSPPIATVNLTPSPSSNTVLGNSTKTQVIPESSPPKTLQLPLSLLVLSVLVAAAGALGYWVMGMRSLQPSPTPVATQQPTTEPTTAPRTLDKLAAGWVIKTNRQIKLTNDETFPPGSFLEVIETKPQSNSDEFTVDLRLCTTESQNPEKPIEMNLSQLQRFGVSVLPSDAPSPCTQKSDSIAPNPNPPVSNTP